MSREPVNVEGRSSAILFVLDCGCSYGATAQSVSKLPVTPVLKKIVYVEAGR